MDDGLELGEHVAVRFRRVGVVPKRELDDGEPQRPHVGGHGVGPEEVERLALDAFGLVEWTVDQRAVHVSACSTK